MREAPEVLVPAPALREVAETWWEVERDPVVVCDADATTFWLVDPRARERSERRLLLARFVAPVADRLAVAQVLADGLAACDFPPTDTSASPARVAATFKAARMIVPPFADRAPTPRGQGRRSP